VPLASSREAQNESLYPGASTQDSPPSYDVAVTPRDIAVVEFDDSAVIRRSRSLPHWEMPRGIYFVTFRLDDSIPEEVSKAYFHEMRTLEDRLEGASAKD
jgi:hypothetical protein